MAGRARPGLVGDAPPRDPVNSTRLACQLARDGLTVDTLLTGSDPSTSAQSKADIQTIVDSIQIGPTN